MIKINENLYIDADDNQYMLRKFIGKDKDGEDIYKTITYHRTLKEVFLAVIRQRQYKLVGTSILSTTIENLVFNLSSNLLHPR